MAFPGSGIHFYIFEVPSQPKQDGFLKKIPSPFSTVKVMLQPIERIALLLQPKDEFYNWLAQADRKAGSENNDAFRNDPTVYLIEPFYTLQEKEKFLQDHYLELWRNELSLWHEEELWPTDMSLGQFLQWFDLHLHREVFQLHAP